MSRRYTYLAALVAALCVFFIIRAFFFGAPRTVRQDIIQGVLVGFGLAFVSAQLYAQTHAKRVNGWVTMYDLGAPGNGMLLRAAQAQLFLGPVNVAQEALYWWTNSDAAGRVLSGAHNYVLHFPPGGLPPNQAFWSLTMGDARNHFVANPLKRYSISERAGLSPNPDGSIDILIQHAAPPGRTANWLPAPPGQFILWLRVYLPGPAILDGHYAAPPVVEVA